MFTRNQLCRSFSAHVLRKFDLAGLITGRLSVCQSWECRRCRRTQPQEREEKCDSAEPQHLKERSAISLQSSDKVFAGYFVVSVAGGSGSISTAFLIRLA